MGRLPILPGIHLTATEGGWVMGTFESSDPGQGTGNIRGS